MLRLSLAFTLVGLIAAPVATAATHGIAVRYDAALVSAGFPSPVVVMTVGSERAVFLIDTGAGVHTFARWFVTASRLRAEQSDGTTVGSTGQETRVDVVSNVATRLDDGRRLLVPQAIVVDFPPIFEQKRIGGVLSPQLLSGANEEAVLNLLEPSLSFRRARVAAGEAGAASDAATVCTNAESPFRNRLYASAVLLDGAQATLLIDTGATQTMLAAESAAARSFGDRAVPGGGARGVGGAVQKMERVPAVGVTRGGAVATIDVGIGTARNNCGPDGLLGMDALARCVLVL